MMEGATSRNAVPGSCLRRIDPAREKNCHATKTLDRLMDPEDTRPRPHPTSRLEHGTNQPTEGVSKRTWRRRCSALGAFRIARFSRLQLTSVVWKNIHGTKRQRTNESARTLITDYGASERLQAGERTESRHVTSR